jgi:hypothetical protein
MLLLTKKTISTICTPTFLMETHIFKCWLHLWIVQKLYFIQYGRYYLKKKNSEFLQHGQNTIPVFFSRNYFEKQKAKMPVLVLTKRWASSVML